MSISINAAENGIQGKALRRRPARPSRGRSVARAGGSTALTRTTFVAGVAALDGLVVMAAALLANLVYQQTSQTLATLTAGACIGLLFMALNLAGGHYEIPTFLSLRGQVESACRVWLTAFGAAMTVGFLTKTTEAFSRGAIAILFVGGFAALMGMRNLLAVHMRSRAQAGTLVSRTIMLVGSEPEIMEFLSRYKPEDCGLQVVGAAVLREGADHLADDLSLAVAQARMAPPDDVFLLLPWGDAAMLDRCVDMFRRLPSSIHLGPTAFLQRYGAMRVDRSGPICSMHLVGSPMSPAEVMAKRVLDVALATVAVLLLSPVFLLAAIAIKLESRGPVFFLQRRYGFNQQPFRIVKFRSMTTMEDGARLTQVTVGDRRVTRVGRLLRRTSIDELPQLFNVIRGDMSIVGPRPHALAHDQQFERTIASYARRHNVRPGITGWAQVRGFRGETDTPEKIRGRVEHDFHYIDNWSFWFDLSIMLRTVLSPRTFHNAH